MAPPLLYMYIVPSRQVDSFTDVAQIFITAKPFTRFHAEN